jgi:hypothetical protein
MPNNREPKHNASGASGKGGDSDRYVQTDAILKAVVGHEDEVLKAVGIDWPGGNKHITCPYSDHQDKHPSWRWDDQDRKAFCSCRKAHSIFDVVSVMTGVDFEAAKLRVAEAIGRTDLIRAPGKHQAMDAASLLAAPVENRDDRLPIAYLAHRLGVSEAEVPSPSTRMVGIKALSYFDAPTGTGDRPRLVGEFPCAVFETVGVDGRRHAHRIYLAPGGAGKADLGKRADGEERDPKKSATKVDKSDRITGRGVIWGDPAQALHLIVAEGIETAAAVALVWRAEIQVGTVAVVSAVDANGIEAFRPWPATRIITVAADRDEGVNEDGRPRDQRGERAARKLAMARQDRVEVRIALPGKPDTKTDWLDVLQADGAAAVRASVDGATPFVRADAGPDMPEGDTAKETRSDTVGRLKLVMFDEIKPRLTSNYIVKGVLGESEMSVVYGESGCGKTFFDLDLVLHVAAGKEWRGRRVRQGGVVYVAAEGGHGINNRVIAFKQHHDIESGIPFAAVPYGIDLLSPDGDTSPLIGLIKLAAERFGMPVKLVVIDTLARAMAGGNENAPDDMGAYVRNIDRIREVTAAHVMSIHHSGKDAAKGARGHSSLRAATDTEIEVSRDSVTKVATARVMKQKELPTEGEFVFSLESVELGEDEDGDPVKSCIVVDADCPPPSSRPRLSPNHQTALDLLRRAVIEGGEKPPPSNHIPLGILAVRVSLWRSFCYAGQISVSDDPETKKKAFKRASDALAAKHLIGIWGDWVWLATDRGTERDTKGHVPPVSPDSVEGDRKGHIPLRDVPFCPLSDPGVDDGEEAKTTLDGSPANDPESLASESAESLSTDIEVVFEDLDP